MRLLFTVLSLLALACAEVKVHTSYDTRVDFSKYKTWCWLNGCTPSYEGPRFLYDSSSIENVANTIAIEMQEKGFIQGDESAELMLDFHIVLKEDSSMAAWVHEEDLPFWDSYKEPGPYYHFLRGSLIIDVIDRERGQVIWRSNAERLMALTPEMENADIKRGIKKALKYFPPQEKK
ncbi:hypothetical protein C900_00836 [Fulvivirga imtechensis AK7]|uniref:DUF4136 domain-containing protein n=1 Tax=Fulvivirga imtechensis AK7 TaxID=1237149 RepID=L8JVP5_9BACT|nr:DUF4136 domain-containing protein [Fulvivirga imtechensis]ELR72875.1 hypothetical protein C900_00836 [Fulvivirga imtechensis AK7]